MLFSSLGVASLATRHDFYRALGHCGTRINSAQTGLIPRAYPGPTSGPSSYSRADTARPSTCGENNRGHSACARRRSALQRLGLDPAELIEENRNRGGHGGLGRLAASLQSNHMAKGL